MKRHSALLLLIIFILPAVLFTVSCSQHETESSGNTVALDTEETEESLMEKAVSVVPSQRQMEAYSTILDRRLIINCISSN